MKNLETNRLILEELQESDTNEIFNAILNNKEALYFLDWQFCESIDKANNFIKTLIRNIKQKNQYFWVIREKETNGFVGCITVCNYIAEKRMAEIEYVANSLFRGKGYIPEANKRVIEYLIKEGGLYRIEGVCNGENIASSRVMEKSEMKFEGILRGRALNLNEEGNPGDLKMFSIIPKDLQGKEK